MRAMARNDALLAEKRRILQLETLYDLAIALHAQRPEQELVDELLQRVCAVLDPAAAVAVTRDAYGGARGCASVGWLDELPSGDALLAAPIWRELLMEGHTLARSNGELAGRPYEQLLAAPLSYRGVFLGYVAVLDKEVRGDSDHSFTADDRRFLDSVSALAGAALDAARQVERLETQRERLEEENKALKGRLAEEVGGRRIVAHAPPMRRVLDVVERVAPRGVNVLVREIRARYPKIPIIAGGPHPTYYPQIIDTWPIDAVVVGEGVEDEDEAGVSLLTTGSELVSSQAGQSGRRHGLPSWRKSFCGS